MAVSKARAAAFDILLRVEREQAFASELLHSHLLSTLSVEDRALCTELVMGTLRWRSVLDREIAEHAGRPLGKLDLEVLLALRLGAYQMQFLQRIPARAAANESVELVKRARKSSAAGFANAVLRKLAQQARQEVQTGGLQSPSEIAAALSHPEWLVARWSETYGHDSAIAICRYGQQPPPAMLRLPFDPALRAAAESELLAAGIQLDPGTLLGNARIVRGGNLHSAKAILEHRVSIQDEGSQLVALLVGRGKRLLDCCAAPGGKTSILAERNPEAKVLATELHPHRARLLQERVTAPNVEVRTCDITAMAAGADCDRVLADVPCSGTGTLARNPEIRWRLQAEDLGALHAEQLAILQASTRHLAPGGRLVYSTCSLEPEECGDVVTEFLQNNPGLLAIDCRTELNMLRETGELVADPDSLCRGSFLRTIPGIHSCDGFFAAILENCVTGSLPR